MDAGFGSWAAHYTDRLAGSFARARVGLGTLTTNWQAAQVTNAAIALNALQALQVHTNLTAEVAFDDILAVLNRMDDLRKLCFRQVLGPDARLDIGLGQDDFGIGGANAVNIAKRDIDALIRRNFYTNDTSHK